jgi:hypothetical protein
MTNSPLSIYKLAPIRIRAFDGIVTAQPSGKKSNPLRTQPKDASQLDRLESTATSMEVTTSKMLRCRLRSPFRIKPQAKQHKELKIEAEPDGK